MERPSPNQLPPEYTGPEAPVANPEMLERQDLRYGMIELTGNIQKIVESGNEEHIGDYLKEVIDGKNESVSQNERRAAFELLATTEAKKIDRQIIKSGEVMLTDGIQSNDRLLQEQASGKKRIQNNISNAEHTFNSKVKRPVIFEDVFDQRRISSGQNEMIDNLRSSSRAMDDHEELYGNWAMKTRENSGGFLQEQERGNAQKGNLIKAGEKLKKQPDETPEDLDKLFTDSTIESVATELVNLSNDELDDDAIEEILNKLGVEGDKDSKNIIYSLKSLAEHAYQESRTVVVSIESAVSDIKSNTRRLIRMGEELTYGSANRRLVDAQEIVHSQGRFLTNTLSETDQMLRFGERKVDGLSSNFKQLESHIKEYLSKQNQVN